MEKSELQKKVREDRDFIHAPKFSNSLQKYLAKNDNLLENNTIGRLLLIPSDEVERIYQESIIELRKEMVSDEDEI